MSVSSIKDTCRQCGLPCEQEDFLKLARIKFSQPLCGPCYTVSRKAGYARQARRCHRCGDPTMSDSVNNACPTCTVRDRVGADVFECDCGNKVPMENSVRMMRKSTRRIERVCQECATGDSCEAGKHSVITSSNKKWDAEKWPFQPMPEDFRAGYCSGCDMALYWTGTRWTRMSWAALATAWEHVDA